MPKPTDKFYIVTQMKVHTVITEFRVQAADAKAAEEKVRVGKAGTGKEKSDSARSGFSTRTDLSRNSAAAAAAVATLAPQPPKPLG